MLHPQFVLPIHHELVVDLFAGGGGASTGIEQAIGRHPDIAVNHDPEAVSLHTANHPQTRHFCSDVFEVDPLAVTGGQPVGLLWASPDCKHFSKAKGGKPVSKKIRGLAWVVVKWAESVRPRVICLENVEEFQAWGPLGEDDRPCPQRKGQTFELWKSQLQKLGYLIEHRELRACDFDTPTIRKRLFLVARCDGQPIVWPQPTHAKPDAHGKVPKSLLPWRTAAECIDWSIPCPSIFERSKPLADATCRRIAKGIMRYVVEATQPFIAPTGHSNTLVQTGYGERPGQSPRVPGLGKPLGTVVAGQKHALVTAFLAKHYTGVVGSSLADPTGTVTSVDHHSLITAHMVTIDNQSSQGGHRPAGQPLLTTTTENRHAIVTSHICKLRGDNVGSAAAEPLHTVSAQGMHHGEVRAFLVKYYSEGGQDQSAADPMHTIPTKDRLGLVMVHGEPWAIVDIGLRMLTPRELYRAQGFPEDYIIDRGADGRLLTKTAQVRMCGNSVCPPIARALVAANYAEHAAAGERRAA
ncbi:DNA cytosine methyltransferase [Rivihabitans pingtungensis]|uniref:DNA cytosine methyltransferase n=1 Tax=Rivihabitans pingtungensis TaxID=1054498 RepID=UPI00235426C3|nr:DNA cytosine methyltransferase [Rivihabitans pingtungensis]MCK6435999.1 DNA cytosine methyltransferase [Rivihabitans pingtungensis]